MGSHASMICRSSCMQCCRLRESGSSVSPSIPGPFRQPFDLPGQARQVGQRLVMQVHADPLAFALQRLGQVECAQPQAFLARPRLRFDDGRTLGLSAARSEKK